LQHLSLTLLGVLISGRREARESSNGQQRQTNATALTCRPACKTESCHPGCKTENNNGNGFFHVVYAKFFYFKLINFSVSYFN
jgi:hypothetical protein